MSENHYEHQMWCVGCRETRTFKLDAYGHEAIYLKCENCGHLIPYIRHRREVTNEELLEYLQRNK